MIDSYENVTGLWDELAQISDSAVDADANTLYGVMEHLYNIKFRDKSEVDYLEMIDDLERNGFTGALHMHAKSYLTTLQYIARHTPVWEFLLPRYKQTFLEASRKLVELTDAFATKLKEDEA